MARDIVLLTDFGRSDPYAGVMELVMARLAPDVRVVHLTHGIPPQRVDVASFVLAGTARHAPNDAVVCAVVDPGVGTDRAAVAVKGRLSDAGRELDLTLVLPDNGLATEILPRLVDVHAVRLSADPDVAPEPSATFHGRDVFAPAAARLAVGAALASLGPQVIPNDLNRLELSRPTRTDDGWSGTVRYVDRFGDLVSDIPAERVHEGAWTVDVGGTNVGPLATTFGSVAEGEGVAYIGSWGTVEAAVRNGSAADRWNLGLGDAIRLRRVG